MVPRTQTTAGWSGYALASGSFSPIRPMNHFPHLFVASPLLSSPRYLPVGSNLLITWCLDKIWLQPPMSSLEDLVWKGAMTKQAERFHYLLPSASALWALYHSIQEPQASGELRAHAYRLNIAASNMFRGSDLVVTDRNWLAILAFGITVMIFHFAAAQLNPTANADYDYLEIFHLVRSTRSMATTVAPFFHRSSLRDIVSNSESAISVTMDENVWQAVQRLASVHYPEGTPGRIVQTCRRAIAVLQSWVQETDGYPRSWLHFMLWPGSVSDDFVELLITKQPVALLIYIYWCAIMHRLPKLWFMNGWARRNAFLAMAELDANWDCFLEWPRGILNESDKDMKAICWE